MVELISMVYVSVARVCVARLKLGGFHVEFTSVSTVPFEATSLTLICSIVLLVICTVACCPLVPLKVSLAFCPGVVVVAVTAWPPAVMGALKSVAS
jgi:hypothetical protein